MKRTILSLGGTIPILVSLASAACAGSFPVPAQHMADAEAARRSAIELGASNQPDAQLHLKLADEQIAKARTAIANGDNREADSLLIRARADSELALALAKEQASSAGAQRAAAKAAGEAGTTTITSTTVSTPAPGAAQ
jgi:hypothetical protein